MAPTRRHPPSSTERWLPPGHRWGFGARSVLPYLNRSLQAKLLASDVRIDETGPIRNPVFEHMEIALRPKRR